MPQASNCCYLVLLFASAMKGGGLGWFRFLLSLWDVPLLLLFLSLLIASPCISSSASAASSSSSKVVFCPFPAIFNFGDSNSDTGGLVAAFPPEIPPNGRTYFHRPSGRYCDGRLVIDFIAEALGLPYPSPYLQSIGSNFRHGANFASAGTTVLQPATTMFKSGLSPFYLDVQLSQFRELKALTFHYYSQGKFLDMLPTPEDFSQSIYTLDIGQNDFTSQLDKLTTNESKELFPRLVDGIASAIKGLYSEGGRTFIVTNLAPVGCLPAFLVNLPNDSSGLDQYGCNQSHNKLVHAYNTLLEERVAELQVELYGSSVIYLDSNSIKYELVANYSLHGFKYTTRACCGVGGKHNFNSSIFCGKSKIIDGKLLTSQSCEDPSVYINWDGVHNTEAANHYIASRIISGQFFKPPFPIKEMCNIVLV